MLKSFFRLPLLLFLLPCLGWGAALDSMDLPEPAVAISNQDGTLVLNISYRVPVSQREAWAVLTDFENMAGFIPNLESSKVLLRAGKTIQVEQKGSISLGMFPVHYESRRQIEAVPYQSIRSHTLSGNTRLESVMVLSPAGNGTLLSYHATATPELPVPNGLISSYMSEMVENQFKAMGQEMVRRAQANHREDAGDAPQLSQQAGQTSQPAKLAAGKTPPKQAVRQSKLTPKKPGAQTKKRPG